MNSNVHQGLHGEGFVYALACAAGLTTSRMNLDIDGVDWQFGRPGARGTTRSPRIEFQVKSCCNPVVDGQDIRYRLKVAHYNKLAGDGFLIPRFLALVVVPPDASQYAICTDEFMQLGTAAYWVSLVEHEERPEEPGGAKTVEVRIPRENLLDVTALTRLLAGDRVEAE